MQQNTPRSERLHIGIFGATNAGKSSLMNCLLGQQVAITSPIHGTTTDTVYKNIEINGIGPCTIMDTPGWNDNTPLQEQRMLSTRQAIAKTDIALCLIAENDTQHSMQTWTGLFGTQVKFIYIINHHTPLPTNLQQNAGLTPEKPIHINCHTKEGIDTLLQSIKNIARTKLHTAEQNDLTGTLTKPGDTVVLVMPQDASAPQGRLIMPQVQTIRHLLDKGCNALCTTPQNLTHCLQNLNTPPALIITDSQVFVQVENLTPANTPLTSFSILQACQKGDVKTFIQGAKTLLNLQPDAHILIAEACSHTPQHEDIGRVKLPALLRKKLGDQLHIDHVSGNDFPADLTQYNLVIHCGACMFTRTHVLNRINQTQQQNIPITNYGIAIAALTGILDKVSLPTSERL